MTRAQSAGRTAARTAAALVLGACASTGGGTGQWVELETESAAGPVIQVSGTVRHLDLEGGVFVIHEAGGTQYNPTNLPEAFRMDGKPVEAEGRLRGDVATVGMVGPVLELLRIRERAGAGEDTATAGGSGTPSESTPADDSAAELAGTKWRLEDLAGQGVVDRVEATLEFTPDGRVAGHGSCNSFGGAVEIGDGTISFGPLVATRMFCGEAVSRQETEYLAALDAAERWEIEEPFLLIYAAGQPAPLRFIRQ